MSDPQGPASLDRAAPPKGGAEVDDALGQTLADGVTSGASTARGAGATGDADLPAGTVIGEYRIEGVIGRGGFGTVYRALQPVIGKPVAIKVLARKYSADPEIVSRFSAEARAVNQIRHRHIIDIFAFGELPDGRAYYVMELLEGEPLDRYLAHRGVLNVEQALPILRAIARALDAAHAKGITHRDLKPENIFVARDDDGEVFPKLLDFGVAKLRGDDEQLAHRTGTGVPIGTPYFMAPEQCRGIDVDARADLYALGVVIYRLLTGTYPFEGGMIEIMHQHLHDAPEPPSKRRPELGATVDRAVLAMMAKEPAARPASAIAAVMALVDAGGVTPMLTPATGRAAVAAAAASTAADLTYQVPRRRAMPWIAIGVVFAAAVAVLVVMMLREKQKAGDAPAVEPVKIEVPAPAAVTEPAPPPPAPPAPPPVVETAPAVVETPPVVEPPRAGSAARKPKPAKPKPGGNPDDLPDDPFGGP